MHFRKPVRKKLVPPRHIGVALCIAVLVMGFSSLAHALSYPIFCEGVHVGDVTVNVDGSGVSGGFTSIVGMPPSLDAAALICDEDHFNWFQVIVADNMPLNDANGNPLVPPYIDPPLGGYGPPDTQWADGLPWYWDEGADPPPGTDGFDDGYNLDDNLSGGPPPDTLDFSDFPGGAAGSSVTFQTWLVSLNADGSLHEFHEGFSWMWSNPTGGAGTSVVFPNVLNPHQGHALYQQLVPEPASVALLVIGLAAVASCRRRFGN